MSKKYVNSIVVDNNYIRKKYNKNVVNIYEILSTTNFNNYPKIIDYNDEYIYYEYIKSKKIIEKNKGENLIKLVAKLHNETTYYKDVSKNKYKTIYNKLYGNINYLKKYYFGLIDSIENEMFMSPSHYLFARNYSLIQKILNQAESNLKKWYKLVENKTNQRVCVIHNNLSLNHFIKSDNDYLISFDRALVDTPVLDIYKFYKNEGYKLNFKELLKIYNTHIDFEDEEKILLNILLATNDKIKFTNDEYFDSVNIKNILNYMHNFMEII